jgi:trigger factor
MKVSSKQINSANGIVNATISKAVVEAKEKVLAQKAAKDMKVDGFRKGKVPVQVIISRYGAQIRQDSQNAIVQEVFEIGIKDLGDVEVLGNPKFTKFEEKEDGIDLEFKVALRPAMNLTDYDKLVPYFKAEKVTEAEINKSLEDAAKAVSEPVKLKRKRMLREGDIAIFDFEGIVDGKSVESATAKNFSLEIGSGRLIEGFESGMVGMKYDETKELDLKFPETYHAKELAGKDVKFIVTLNEIQEKEVPEINDDLAKKLIPNDPEMTLEKLKEIVKESLESEKTSKLYNSELKPKLLETLVKAFDFALPENIVEEEVNSLLNNKIRTMSEEEIKALREDEKKLEALKKEVEPEAAERVKTTLIVDELAKQEGVTISDQEVAQTMYYEAMQMGQDPKAMMDYYQSQGLMPIVKMSMLEDRVLSHLLNKKLETKPKGKKS